MFWTPPEPSTRPADTGYSDHKLFLHERLSDGNQMIKPPVILVVEDEETLREVLTYQINRQGYQVVAVGDGNAALEAARSAQPNLILLDVILPGIDGFEVCRILRKETNIPIFFLTARDDEIDRVLGLEMGGDDYILKPFSMRELLARIKARFRSLALLHPADKSLDSGEQNASVLVFGDLVIDHNRHEVKLKEHLLPLKPKEFEVLALLTKNHGQVLTRGFLYENVWGHVNATDTRSLDVHIRWLRNKIEQDAAHPTRIFTIRGVGYRFDG